MSYMYMYMYVEAFATGIKIGSTDQSGFLGANHGMKVTFELTKHATAI